VDARVTIGRSRYVLLGTGRGDWWVEWELAGRDSVARVLNDDN
jgi:hypothetical protein